MSALTAKANVAATEALRAGANPRDLDIARSYMGAKAFIGYCQAFVNRVTGGKTSGASAIQAWNNAPQKVQGTTQGMQPGDLVYFSPNSSNRGYGHTGIYAGNNQFISATDNGVKQTGLFDWMKETGQKLLGYVPAVERALGFGGQQSPQKTQPSFIPPTPEQAINHNVQARQIGMQSQVPIPTPPIPDIVQQRRQPINLNPSQDISQNA